MQLRKILIPTLGVLTLGSIGLNLALYQLANRYYGEGLRVRMDAADLNAYPIDDRPKTTRPVVVFFGDSRAGMWTSPNDNNFEFINRGVDGETTCQQLARLHAHLQSLHPHWVVLETGINDLKSMPFVDGPDAVSRAVIQRLDQLISELQAMGSKIVLCTIFPRGPVPFMRPRIWNDRVDQAIENVNRHIRGSAKSGVEILDADLILKEQDGLLKPEFASDMLHVNRAGYEVLNEQLMKALK